LFFGNSILGMDIDSKLIKIVELNKKTGQLINYKIIPAPKGAIKDGKINKPELIGKRIKESLKESKIKTKKVVSGIPGRNVLSRYLTLPKMSLKELEEAIKWETQDYLSFFSEEVLTDFQIVEEVFVDNVKHQKILFVAVPLSVSEALLESIKKAGLNPIAIEINAISILRVFRHNYDQKNRLSAIINIGPEETNMIISYNGNLRLNRTINIGCEDLAETGKHQAYLSTNTEGFINQVKRFINFYSSQNRGVEVKEILLCGEGSTIESIKDIFQQNFDIPVKMLDPCRKIKTDPRLNEDLFNKKNLLTSAIGMALRG